MLKNLKYVGYAIRKSCFESFDIESSGGSIILNVEMLDVKDEVIHDDGNVTFLVPLQVNFFGIDKESDAHEKGEGNKVFDCEQRLDLEFMWFIGDEDVEPDAVALVADEAWYFENYAETIVQATLKKALSDTRFQGVPVGYR